VDVDARVGQRTRAVSEPHAPRGQEWCSLRVRFSERELVLLRGAEHVRGADLAQHARPNDLRGALALAKSGHKLRAAGPGTSLTFEEHELRLLVDALHFAATEIRWAASQRDESTADARRAAVLGGFPELTERGLWRSFALTREITELATRLEQALAG
jgi:hypothetical protein